MRQFFSEKCSHCKDIKAAQEQAAAVIKNASDGMVKFYRIDDFRFGSYSRDFSFSQLNPGFEDGNVPKVFYMKKGLRYPMPIPPEGIGYDGWKKLVEWIAYHSSFDKVIEANLKKWDEQEAKAAWQKKRDKKKAKEDKHFKELRKKEAKMKKEVEKKRAAEKEAARIASETREAERREKAALTSTTTPTTKKEKKKSMSATATTTTTPEFLPKFKVGDYVDGKVLKVFEDELLLLVPGLVEPARLVFSSDIVTEDFWVDDGKGGERPIAKGDPVTSVQVKKIDVSTGHVTLLMETEPIPASEEDQTALADAAQRTAEVEAKLERLAKWWTSDDTESEL